MRATHKHADDKYELLRNHTRGTAVSSLPQMMTNSRGQLISVRESIQLTAIDFHSRVKAKSWEGSPFRQVSWDWSEGAADYAWIYPKRFELAIWYRGMFLGGLSLGRPTWGGGKLRLDFIEASPDETPLTGLITDITIAAAEVYADAIGAEQLRIMNPINEKVRSHYLAEGRGFTYDNRGNFCFRDLK